MRNRASMVLQPRRDGFILTPIMAAITTIEDLRRIARRRTPRMFYDYAASGAYSEDALRRNVADFAAILLRQRVAVDMTDRSLATELAGQAASMPVALAPVGLLGMQHPDGEIHAARAAEAAGIPYTLSTMSVCSIEDIAAHTSAPFWFQLYFMRDHDFSKRLVQRARDAGCSALVLTLDLQLLAQRHADVRNGLSTPPKMTIGNIIDMAIRPRWCLNMLRTPRRTFGNIAGHAKGVSDMSSLAAWTAEQFDPRLDWDSVKRIQDWWGGKIILKGILDPADAEAAVRTGAEAIVVSNHGGRQLDAAPSSISVLPRIVAAVGGDTEILLDGGIRTGQDVLKAIALGAKGVLMGRAQAFGVMAGGEAGVAKAIDIIRSELDTNMALCGHRDIKNVGEDIIHHNPFAAHAKGG